MPYKTYNVRTKVSLKIQRVLLILNIVLLSVILKQLLSLHACMTSLWLMHLSLMLQAHLQLCTFPFSYSYLFFSKDAFWVKRRYRPVTRTTVFTLHPWPVKWNLLGIYLYKIYKRLYCVLRYEVQTEVLTCRLTLS